jgi:putative heme-binding domain-containing protein
MIGDVRHGAAGAALLPLLKDSSPRARFFAAEALARTAYKPAASALVEMLAANDDRDVYLRHAGSLALSQIGDAAALSALSKHPSRAVRIAAIVALRRMGDAGVAQFLADPDEQVVVEAARAINDDGGIASAIGPLAAVLAATRSTSEPLLRRLINANLRAGGADAANRVAAFAEDAARPERLRVEAVATLGVWESPSTMDRVDGIHLEPLAGQQRDGSAARIAVQRIVEGLATSKSSPEMKVAVADAAGRLGVRSAVPVLLAQLRGDPSSDVRLASLRALQALKVDNMDELMQIALADKDAAVRRAALGILPGLSMSESTRVQHVASLVKTGALAEKQGAIQVLGTMKSSEARALLGTYVDELVSGKTAPELQIDVIDAVQSGGAANLVSRLEEFQKVRKAETLVQAFREGLLRGGDVRRGMQVATDNPAAECTRCHSIPARPADVGPNLQHIASTLSREQLLEALIEPNARIAPGYGTVGITLKDGTRVDGTLREENATDVVLQVGTPPVERRIAKTDIAQRTNPVSAMPPFGLILKPRDLRDLVEFLTTLK